ncbi:MAG TPA: Uma2 family endonuclease [Thermoanaerobaculia bacterium]|jgi:Uma2 family endonuclease|nr:Uma2 family endonuclease [Thermoanaerobaculia bacterium]
MTSPLPQARHRYTYEDYLALELDSELKHEFDDGEIFAMAGGSPRHSALAFRITATLENTRPSGCIGFQSDMRVRILATGRATYPDVSMVCGPIELDPADRSGTTITNPTLLVEVLSPSTEAVDRVSKWRDYQRIPSLQEYVLVNQKPRIEIYRRHAAGNWEYLDVREGVVKLASGAVLDLSILYSNLPA